MNPSTLPDDDFYSLLEARHADPFRILGLRKSGDRSVARVWRPEVETVTLRETGGEARSFVLPRVHPDGLFEATLPGGGGSFAYELELHSAAGGTWREADPYAFGPVLGELDVHLFNEGTHYEVYKKLGAHLREHEGVWGTHFAVWAPNAQRVSVVGDFNHWDGRVHPLRKLIPSGVWEIFVPGAGEGTHYKFEIRGPHGEVFLKTDPFAFYAQHGTETGCMVFDLERYAWSDARWMEERTRRDPYTTPMSIYEVHPGSWARVPEDGNRPLSYLELGDKLIPYVLEMGFTHIELMPVMEHPFDGSWGYQVVNYYAPTSRFGNPDEFRHFVDRCHQAGLGVLLDWVPGHFPKDAHGLARFDGTCLYEHEDPRLGEHKEWGTLIFNYGRNEVKNFLIGNALYWLDEFHVDGLRVDAVASMLYLDYSRQPGEWVPNCFGGRENLEAIAFLKRCNEVCYDRFPGIVTMAEESTSWPGVSRPTFAGGLGFGLKWNMGWMNDSLRYISKEPIYRRYHQGEITFSMLYAFHEHFILVLSHDEVVHGKGSFLQKMPGDLWQKFANARMFLAWMWAHPGKKLIFQGIEFGVWDEWNHGQSLNWDLNQFALHDGLRRLVQHLNALYTQEPALFELDDSPDGFEWVDFRDSDNCVWSFLRKSRDGQTILFVINATPVVRGGYRVGVPGAGWYDEILNTDAQTYGGGNVGNFGGLSAEDHPWQGKSHSVAIDLPPLAVVAFKNDLSSPKEMEKEKPLTNRSTMNEAIPSKTNPMKPKRPSAFTLIELLVVISIIGILAALALPAITSALVKGQMTQSLSNMRQLHLATQSCSLDATTTGDATIIGWPGTNNFATWATNLVPSYLGTNDFAKLLSAAGKITAPSAFPGANTNAISVYQVAEESQGDMVFLSTANWTNATELSPNSKPYGNKGFVIFHKAGDGQILLPKQYDSTNVIGVVTNRLP